MKKDKRIYLLSILGILSLTLLFVFVNKGSSNFDSIIKVVLRDAGDKLLKYDKDSTSLILPIRKLDSQTYQLTFQKKLSIEPDSLVNSFKNSLLLSDIKQDYLVEVRTCNSQEVSYSYQITKNDESTIIPCLGRNLPLDCYMINIQFLEYPGDLVSWQNTVLLLVFLFVLFGIRSQFKQRKLNGSNVADTFPFTRIGSYKFYKDQNKLVKEKIEIPLTSKECELIDILGKNPNQIVKRETLIKKVWEDNGVVVGRSLDTYISKLRKKFSDDDSIKIINIHGVGYKLEIF